MSLYIDQLLIGGMETPDGEDPAAFWRLGDITAAGRPIRFGAQLADRVNVRLTALVKPAGHQPERHPCVD